MHPATQAILTHFTYAHLPQHLQEVSKPYCDLANTLARALDGPEVTVALRKLLESKDCAVRARIDMARRPSEAHQ